MKKFISLLPVGLLSIGLLAAIPSLPAKMAHAVENDEYTEYETKYYGQRYFTKENNTFPCTNFENWHNFGNTSDQSWVRFIVDVPTEGDYKIYAQINHHWNTNSRAYINNTNAIAVGDDSSYSGCDNAFTGHFNSGKNVVIVEMIWNDTQFSKICFPSTFELLSTDSGGNYFTVNGENFGMEVLYDGNTSNLFNPDYVVYPGKVYPKGTTVGDGWQAFAPNSEINFHTNEDSNGTYKLTVSNISSVTKSLSCSIDGGSSFTIDIPSYSSEEEFEVGKLQGGSHTIKLWQESDSAGARLTVHKLSVEVDAPIDTITSINGSISGLAGTTWNTNNITVLGSSATATDVDITDQCDIEVLSPELDEPGSGNDAVVKATLKSDPSVTLTVSNIPYTIIDKKDYWDSNNLYDYTLVHGRSIRGVDFMSLDWSNGGVEFDLIGGGDVQLDVASINGAVNIATEVDGVMSNVMALTTGLNTIASNLSADSHRIRIYKTNEVYNTWGNPKEGMANISGIKTTNLTKIVKPQEGRLNIEVIGDSISVGVGLDGNENSLLAFPHLLEEAYDANVNIVATNGLGLVASWVDHQMNEIYSYANYYRNSSTKYTPNDFNADIVIINLGNNDLGASDANTFINAMGPFVSQIKALYSNDVEIIWTLGSFQRPSNNRNDLHGIRTKAIELGGYFVELPYMHGGVNDHPSETEQEYIAQYLSYEISKILEVENPLDSRYLVEAEDATVVGGQAQFGQNGNWSSKGYVGNMQSSSYVEFEFNAKKSAQYLFKMSTSSIKAKIRYSIDEGEIIDSGVTSDHYGGQWDPPSLMENPELVYIDLLAGDHTIRFYGYSEPNCWINYDYFDVSMVPGTELKFTVEFDLNGGTGSVPTQEVEPGELVERPADPILEGHKFVGWFTEDEEEWDFENDVVMEDMTLTAEYEGILSDIETNTEANFKFSYTEESGAITITGVTSTSLRMFVTIDEDDYLALDGYAFVMVLTLNGQTATFGDLMVREAGGKCTFDVAMAIPQAYWDSDIEIYLKATKGTDVQTTVSTTVSYNDALEELYAARVEKGLTNPQIKAIEYMLGM